jgi:hypothetical protein
VPACRRRASLPADSCSLIVPSRGSVTCLRSASTRITPVVNRNAARAARPDLNLGNPTRRPARRPARESEKPRSARANASKPEL